MEEKNVTPDAVLMFPPFRLDPANEQLWRDTQPVPLRPKPFAILRYLVERPHQLVTKEELLKAIWPDAYVSEELLNTYIRDLRKALRDDPTTPRFIETVVRRGYRFIAEVSSQSLGTGPQRSDLPNQRLTTGTWQVSSNFVGRERELERLQRWFEKALRGERQVVFVTGEPGVGKTTLVEAFLQRLAAAGNAWVERGQCVEQYGPGEAYLPVLEALGHSCRRPGGERTIEILRQYAPTWLVQMPALIPDTEFELLQRKVQGATRERMLREMAEALEIMTAKQCSVVVLEDLQWSDYSTLDLLSYVAQRREPACLLVIGTYRPTDAIMSNHPVNAIKQDLQGRRLCGELPVSLLSKEAVDQYLAARFPHHQFPPTLNQLLYLSTEGNSLFLVNVADYLEAKGIVGEVGGQWQLTVKLEEVTLGVPESLRQMIARQIERLTPEEQRILEAASVAGAEFSATAVAAGLGEGLEHIEEHCEELVRRSQFLRSSGTETLPDRIVSGRYGFLHALYQQALYSRLSDARSMRLHRRIAEGQEASYGAHVGTIAAELAVHFERSQDSKRAAHYLRQAAENAVRRSAPREAIEHLTKALGLIKGLPDTAERVQQELGLQMTLGTPLLMTKGYAAPEVERVYARARELCQQIGETPQLFPAIFGLFLFYLTRSKYTMAHELAEQLMRLARREQDSALLLGAHWALGTALLYLGEIASAEAHTQEELSLYNPQQHRPYIFFYGQDLGVASRAHGTWPLWLLGYPDQALERAQEALTLAQELSHPFSLSLALHFVAIIHQFRRESLAAQQGAEDAIRFASEQGFPFWLALATIIHGGELAKQKPSQQGILQIRQGLAAYRTTGADVGSTYCLALLAEKYGKWGQAVEGLAVITEALALVDENGERWWEAELYRIKGELLMQARGKSRGSRSRTPKEFEAEQCFSKALSIACRQSAKSLELRAAVSLSRHWKQQGKRAEACQLLGEIYGWFTEGFETADLQEARALLSELS
jgi:predicted ATPase/DNA-binding winged helix-turn-helix (wHTH) protein